MGYSDLRDFLRHLEQEGELHRVTVPVNPVHEMAEIADRMVKAGGPAIWFESAGGSGIPVVMNLFGTAGRMARALGVGRLEELEDKLTFLTQIPQSTSGMGFWDKLGLLKELGSLASCLPRRVNHAPVQEVVWRGEQVDLARLPILTCWPGDAGPFITLPLVISRHPENGARNVGMYRMQVFSSQTTGMHWHRHKTGRRHLEAAKKAGERLPVAVALGGDPALIYAASAPLPEGFDEMLFAGFLRGEGVEMVRGICVDLDVPARAEIVLEGYVDPNSPEEMEGPFGDHTGFYSPVGPYPVFRVQAVTMRRDAIYPATVVGVPPMEDYWMGQATERLFLPLVRMLVPEVVDYHMPPEGTFHNLVFVSIDKIYPGQAFKVGGALLGLGMMMLAKVVVVLDADVNVRDEREAWWAALANIDPERDIQFLMGPLDDLDHSSPRPGYGSKMVIDATRKLPEEGHSRQWPQKVSSSQEIRALVDRRWKEYGFAGEGQG